MSRLAALTSLLLIGAALVLLAASLAGYWPYTVDDAFITFRYARHWVEGDGLSWNRGGIPQEGYTSVLHLAVLAALGLSGVDLEFASKVLGIVAMAASLGLAAVLGKRLARGPLLPSVAVVVCGAAALPHLPVHGVAGLETTLFSALWMLLALLSDEELVSVRRARVIGAVCLLVGLCRPEGNLIAAVTCATILANAGKEKRKLAAQLLPTYLLPAALYFAWRWHRYGLPFPLPFYVKVSTGQGPQGLKVAAEFVRSIPWVIGLFAAFGMLGAALTTGRWRVLRLGLPAAAFFAFFLWPEHVMGFDFRFFAPLFPLLLAFTAAGLLVACRRSAWLVPVGLVIFGAIALPWRGWEARKQEAWSRYESYANGLNQAHRRVGAALLAAKSQWSHADPLLAIADCGVVPFVSDWRTMDTFGLNEAQFARLRAPRDEAYVERVFAAQPEVLVLLSADGAVFTPLLAWEGLLADAAPARGYELLGAVAFAPNYHLWLYSRPGERGVTALRTSLWGSAGPAPKSAEP